MDAFLLHDVRIEDDVDLPVPQRDMFPVSKGYRSAVVVPPAEAPHSQQRETAQTCGGPRIPFADAFADKERSGWIAESVADRRGDIEHNAAPVRSLVLDRLAVFDAWVIRANLVGGLFAGDAPDRNQERGHAPL